MIDPDIYNMPLYHGTNSMSAEGILKEGLRPQPEHTGPAWLTTSLRDARDMAQETSRERGGAPVVLVVNLPFNWPLEPAETDGFITWKAIPSRYVKRLR